MRFSLKSKKLFLGSLAGLLVFIMLRKRQGEGQGTFLERMYSLSEKFAKKYGYSKEVAKYVTGVAYLESGNGTSKLARKSNNFFGMMRPNVRPTLALPIGVMADEGVFAEFSSMSDSCEDYYMWADYTKMPKDADSSLKWVMAMKARNYMAADVMTYNATVQQISKSL